MKNYLLFLLLVLSLGACATQKDAKYREDPRPKFSNSRDYTQKPDELLPLAEKILTDKIKESDPATDTSVKAEGNGKRLTGWVYGTSQDKYMLVDFNGAPKRKLLPVRRKYEFTIVGSVAGSLVNVNITEEVANLDKKTGEAKGWKTVEPDRALYQRLLADLDLAVNSR